MEGNQVSLTNAAAGPADILRQYIDNHAALRGLGDALSRGDVALGAAAGSAFSYALFALFHTHGADMLAVANDREEAAYLYNEAQSALGDERCGLLVSGFRRAAVHGRPDPESALLRSDLLRNLARAGRQPMFVATYPEALAETCVTPTHIQANTLPLAKGEKISPGFIVEVLAEHSFARVDFVCEPGQFATRGSIVDVFSFSNTRPYRIDFFGDEIETIRSFDIDTQTSLELLDRIEIIPDLANKVTDVDRVPVPDILAPGTVVAYDNRALALQRIAVVTEATDEMRAGAEVDLSRILAPHKAVEEGLARFRTVERRPGERGGQGGTDLGTSAQPSFAKNFEFLAKAIAENAAKGYRTVILSEQEKQLERLQGILSREGTAARPELALGYLHRGFTDHNLRLCAWTDHQIFDRHQKYHLNLGFTRRDQMTLDQITSLHPGDYIVHNDYGIGQFAGLERITTNGHEQEVIKLVYKDHDTLYVNIHALHKISKYKGKDGTPPRIHKLGGQAWQNTKNSAKSKIKDIARELISLYATRLEKRGFPFSANTYLNDQLEASFLYEDTPDQVAANRAVRDDMESPVPMDRLICGDVGFGKTEIAVRAAFKATCDNKQVAVLVPTTILAMQHYKTFTERLKEFPVRVDHLSRMRTAAEKTAILKDLREGRIDILIGTHRIVSKDVVFKDMGLLIVDEEQKFGVKTKEKLRAMKVNVDTLTLTATPIPRTLQFSLMGARDLSVIKTPPPNRLPIHTEIHTFDAKIIADAVNYELERGGQVFVIHNRIQNIDQVAEMIRGACPRARVTFAHGQMGAEQLESIMTDFVEEQFDVLVSTTIIESGLDIANANTIIINEAQNYGLSDLHQLRGRVGRSNKKAFCYLLAPPVATLPAESRRRLLALEAFTELGSGFNIALQDLDIRGAGNLLGGEQSGFISDLGYETYQRVLREAMLELRGEEFKNLLANDQETADTASVDTEGLVECVVDTDLELLLPEYYVENVAERMRLYKQLDNMRDGSQTEAFEAMLRDRFGRIPTETRELIKVVRLRQIAEALGMEKLFVKQGGMTCHFIADPNHPFYQSPAFATAMRNLQGRTRGCRIEEQNGKLKLRYTDITSIAAAIKALEELQKEE